MELDSRATLDGTGMKWQVVTTTEDASPDGVPNQRFHIYFSILYILGVLFMDLLLLLRTDIINKKHQSPFEIDSLFMIMSIVAIFVVVLTSLIMIFKNYYKEISLTRNIQYALLKSIGGFSAILAPFSLVMVLYVPRDHIRTRYELVCVFFVIAVAFFLIWKGLLSGLEDHLQENKRYGFPKIYYVGLLVPIALLLVLLIPSNNFNFIVFLPIHLYWYIVPVYALSSLLIDLFKKTGKPQKVIEQAKIQQQLPI